jgi:hypothetical protein
LRAGRKARDVLYPAPQKKWICAISRMTNWWFASFVVPAYEGTLFPRPPFLDMMISPQ